MPSTQQRLWQRGLLVVGMSGLLLTGCDSSEPTSDTATPVTETKENSAAAPEASVTTDTNAVAQNTDAIQTSSEKNSTPADTAPTNTTDNAGAPAETLAGAQITDMRYQNAAGETISVVYTTAPSGILSARLTLPNQAPMTLDAPEGQGNNPTYRSSDGKTQLVSHGGGNSIDVIVNDTVTSYEATSADARVVTTS